MKFLIIYAHPKSDGFSSYCIESVKNILSEKMENFEVLDLYSMNYDPVLKLEELYTAGNKNVSPENQQLQEKIKNSDRLIFIYPVWWGGMPAILKGFIDRIFIPGFAFKYSKEKLLKFIPDKLLDDKKILILISSGGPKFFYKMLLDPIKLINKFIIFGMFCKNNKTYQFYGAGRINDHRKKEIESVVKKSITWLLK
jgi:NAD(P)H dehydrogenase (quinone)